jgi:hypothetical protein
MNWHLINVKTRDEIKALIALSRQGYHCWLPMCRSREGERVVAWFPGYLFIELFVGQAPPERDPKVGVYGLVQFGDSLAVVPEAVMQQLRERLAEDGGIVVLNRRFGFKKGDLLAITKGRAAGYTGLYDGASDIRCTQLLDILVNGMRLKVSQDAVQAAQ